VGTGHQDDDGNNHIALPPQRSVLSSSPWHKNSNAMCHARQKLSRPTYCGSLPDGERPTNKTRSTFTELRAAEHSLFDRINATPTREKSAAALYCTEAACRSMSRRWQTRLVMPPFPTYSQTSVGRYRGTTVRYLPTNSHFSEDFCAIKTRWINWKSLWNSILPSIRSLTNINQFKRYIIRTLLEKYGYP